MGCLLVLHVAGLSGTAAAPDGETVYRQSCAACHASGENRAPSIEALRRLSAEAVLSSLEHGTMAYVGATLAPGQARAVAEYLGGGTDELSIGAKGNCPDAPWVPRLDGPRWIGWSPDVSNTRFQSAESAGLTADSVSRLRLVWAFGLPNADRARGQPSVVGGRLFVGGRNGVVYALDARSGCTIWKFTAQAEVRTAILLDRIGTDGHYAIYFGDTKANLYAIDAADGEVLWTAKADDHEAATLTGSPVLFEGRLYTGVSSIEEFTASFGAYPCCTFRGSVLAVDASDGRLLWKAHTIPERPEPRRANARDTMQHGPSGAAIWSAPTIDAKLRRIYVATGDNYSDPPTDDSDAVIAYDLDTGKRLWSRQFTRNDAYNMSCNSRADNVNCPAVDGPDFDFGSSAMLVETERADRLLIAGQKSGMVHAMDPDRNGEIVWQRRTGKGGKLGGIQFGPAADAIHAYVAISDFRGARPDSVGGITALRLSDGERAWHRPGVRCPPGRKGCSPAHSAAVTVIPGVVFAGSLDGHLRAYSTGGGRIIWDFDTAREFPNTINGVPAKGGSLNGPGPVVVDGMVFVNSGYGQFGSMAGNVLLAFGPDGD